MVENSQLFIIDELRANVSFLCVVVNGEASNLQNIERIADLVLKRENRGFDAGAYKYAMKNPIVARKINEFDELLLVNDSFLGPLCNLDSIFERMKDSKADFWGLSLVSNELFTHIQSYFLVFKKHVLNSGCLQEFFERFIDENTEDFEYVLMTFENGLFNYLTDSGFTFDSYGHKPIYYSPYDNPFEFLTIEKVPIVKKKFYTINNYDKSQADKVMQYVIDETSYPEEIIREFEKKSIERFSIALKERKSKVSKENDNKEIVLHRKIENFINHYKYIYIYGAGKYALHIYSQYFLYKNHEKFKGFFRSENDGYYLKERVYKYTAEIVKEDSVGVIVAMNNINTGEIYNTLGNKDVLYISDKYNLN